MGKGRVQAEDLHRALDAEISKLQTGSDWSRLLDVAALFPTYGFGNSALINLQMPQASLVAPADMWAKRGRRVRTGEAIRILQPLRSQTIADALGDAGRRYGADGLVERQVIGFRVSSVYDVTATDGAPIYLPPTPSPADATVARALWDGLAREAASDGFALDVRPTGDGSEGFTDHLAKRIVVADHLDDFRAVSRLMHEVAHARMHSPEGLVEVGGVMCRGVREVEAESVAYVVLGHHGVSIKAESFDHIAQWAKAVDPDEPANVIKASGARVINTARQLIESTDKHLKVERTPRGPVLARPLDSAFLARDVDGPTR
ncbi:hypothetical protein JOF29_002821 [Kribbella aluminosa]|uniref:Antirestriction protein ArdC n=1 Tax=Kribbella aluminosa TaxID=416017 RepID=A0ABS4UJA0_9ACTN|nr:ImmA/IrrE family metallo-endopeptidase [Kribbella aluminosa]MBP2351738.1 hypothetical protein [Kribbella aluminosa]